MTPAETRTAGPRPPAWHGIWVFQSHSAHSHSAMHSHSTHPHSTLHSHSAHVHPRPLSIEEDMPWFWIWFRTWCWFWFGEGAIMRDEEEEDSQEEPHDDNWTVGVGFFKALMIFYHSQLLAPSTLILIWFIAAHVSGNIS